MGTPQGSAFRIGRKASRRGHWSEPPWAAAAGILPAAAALLTRMRAIDLAYHVRAGEISLRTGAVLRTDPFTFTRGDLPWLNQQWAAQVVFASAHRALGWAGVAATYAAALGAGFSFLYRSCRRAGAQPRVAAVLTLLGFVVGAGSLAARPQALAIPLFTGTWLLLSRRDRWSWVVLPLSAIWANMHGTFVLAPVLASFAVAQDLVDRRPVGRSASIVLGTVVATFVTPFGPAVWSYTLDVVSDPTIRDSVAEWRPPSPGSVGGALFWSSGVVVAATGWWRRGRVRAMDVARLALFFALGTTATRSTLWWALSAPPVVASWYPSAAQEQTRPKSAPLGLRAAAVALTSILVLAIAFSVRAGTDPVTGAPVRLAPDAPQVLIAATRRALPVGSRLFVFQPFASWFEYALPGYPVMVDSRIELYGDELWHEYSVVIAASDGWEEILDRHGIRGIVLAPGEPLADDLMARVGWRRVSTGAAGSVFIRT